MYTCLANNLDYINFKDFEGGTIVFDMTDVKKEHDYEECSEFEMEPTEEQLKEIDEEMQEEVKLSDQESLASIFGKNELDFYIKQISSIEICTKEEEIEYFKRIAAGDKKARDEFAERNLKLVVSNAKNYCSKNAAFSILDFIQEGNIGLLKAIDQFDVTKGYKFSTYATWWIRQAMIRGFADKSRNIRIPVHMHENIRRYRRTVNHLSQINGVEPANEEVAEEMNIPLEKVELYEKLFEDTVSLSTPVSEDGETSLGEFIEADNVSIEEQYEKKEFYNTIIEAVNTLSPREKEVIVKRFGIGTGISKTLEELGQEYGVTRERIRQIEAKALRRLRWKLVGKEEIRMFLE